MTMTRFLTPLTLAAMLATGCGDDTSSDDGADAGGSDASSSTDPTSADSTGDTGEAEDTTDPTEDATDPTEDTSEDTETGEDTEDSSDADDSDSETTGVAACGEGVPCEDEMILDLGLVSGTVSSGAVSNTQDGSDWVSGVDATAGGIVDAPNNPWLYLRFTDDGLETVDLDDLQALESEDWDLAAKRFGIRLNSGVSGPSCVTVATVDGTYADVAEVPEDASYQGEAFYDGSCNYLDDGSGAGGANFALTPWWFYPGCVGVTYTTFVIERNDGRHVKFMVESYYEDGQQNCNENGMMGSGSANFVWRWAFLD
ncbi:MAG: HmuY family protein [Myxococcota bacterium]